VDYGVGGVEIGFYLKGEEGAVQFKLLTGWLLPFTVGVKTDQVDWKNSDQYLRGIAQMYGRLPYYPSPTDLGYHSRTPRYEDHARLDCHLLDQGFCYYDGSSLNAYEPFDVLLHKGSDGVFEFLEQYYKELFSGAD